MYTRTQLNHVTDYSQDKDEAIFCAIFETSFRVAILTLVNMRYREARVTFRYKTCFSPLVFFNNRFVASKIASFVPCFMLRSKNAAAEVVNSKLSFH